METKHVIIYIYIYTIKKNKETAIQEKNKANQKIAKKQNGAQASTNVPL